MTDVNHEGCLEHIYKNRYGYIEDLKKKLGEEIVFQLEAMGYIENAFDSSGDTWKISKRATQRYESIHRKSFLIERISDWYYKNILRIDFNI